MNFLSGCPEGTMGVGRGERTLLAHRTQELSVSLSVSHPFRRLCVWLSKLPLHVWPVIHTESLGFRGLECRRTGALRRGSLCPDFLGEPVSATKEFQDSPKESSSINDVLRKPDDSQSKDG